MLADEALERTRPDEALHVCRTVEENLARKVAERAPEPLRDRDAEPPFRAVEEIVRKPRPERVLQQLLRRLAADLPWAGETGGELHQRVVEKGGTDLERVRHRRDVHL